MVRRTSKGHHTPTQGLLHEDAHKAAYILVESLARPQQGQHEFMVPQLPLRSFRPSTTELREQLKAVESFVARLGGRRHLDLDSDFYGRLRLQGS